MMEVKDGIIHEEERFFKILRSAILGEPLVAIDEALKTESPERYIVLPLLIYPEMLSKLDLDKSKVEDAFNWERLEEEELKRNLPLYLLINSLRDRLSELVPESIVNLEEELFRRKLLSSSQLESLQTLLEQIIDELKARRQELENNFPILRDKFQREYIKREEVLRTFLVKLKKLQEKMLEIEQQVERVTTEQEIGQQELQEEEGGSLKADEVVQGSESTDEESDRVETEEVEDVQQLTGEQVVVANAMELTETKSEEGQYVSETERQEEDETSNLPEMITEEEQMGGVEELKQVEEVTESSGETETGDVPVYQTLESLEQLRELEVQVGEVEREITGAEQDEGEHVKDLENEDIKGEVITDQATEPISEPIPEPIPEPAIEPIVRPEDMESSIESGEREENPQECEINENFVSIELEQLEKRLSPENIDVVSVEESLDEELISSDELSVETETIEPEVNEVSIEPSEALIELSEPSEVSGTLEVSEVSEPSETSELLEDSGPSETSETSETLDSHELGFGSQEDDSAQEDISAKREILTQEEIETSDTETVHVESQENLEREPVEILDMLSTEFISEKTEEREEPHISDIENIMLTEVSEQVSEQVPEVDIFGGGFYSEGLATLDQLRDLTVDLGDSEEIAVESTESEPVSQQETTENIKIAEEVAESGSENMGAELVEGKIESVQETEDSGSEKLEVSEGQTDSSEPAIEVPTEPSVELSLDEDVETWLSESSEGEREYVDLLDMFSSPLQDETLIKLDAVESEEVESGEGVPSTGSIEIAEQGESIEESVPSQELSQVSSAEVMNEVEEQANVDISASKSSDKSALIEDLLSSDNVEDKLDKTGSWEFVDSDTKAISLEPDVEGELPLLSAPSELETVEELDKHVSERDLESSSEVKLETVNLTEEVKEEVKEAEVRDEDREQIGVDMEQVKTLEGFGEGSKSFEVKEAESLVSEETPLDNLFPPLEIDIPEPQEEGISLGIDLDFKPLGHTTTSIPLLDSFEDMFKIDEESLGDILKVPDERAEEKQEEEGITLEQVAEKIESAQVSVPSVIKLTEDTPLKPNLIKLYNSLGKAKEVFIAGGKVPPTVVGEHLIEELPSSLMNIITECEFNELLVEFDKGYILFVPLTRGSFLGILAESIPVSMLRLKLTKLKAELKAVVESL